MSEASRGWQRNTSSLTPVSRNDVSEGEKFNDWTIKIFGLYALKMTIFGFDHTQSWLADQFNKLIPTSRKTLQY
jgi:hypothetical protein